MTMSGNTQQDGAATLTGWLPQMLARRLTHQRAAVKWAEIDATADTPVVAATLVPDADRSLRPLRVDLGWPASNERLATVADMTYFH